MSLCAENVLARDRAQPQQSPAQKVGCLTATPQARRALTWSRVARCCEKILRRLCHAKLGYKSATIPFKRRRKKAYFPWRRRRRREEGKKRRSKAKEKRTAHIQRTKRHQAVTTPSHKRAKLTLTKKERKAATFGRFHGQATILTACKLAFPFHAPFKDITGWTLC